MSRHRTHAFRHRARAAQASPPPLTELRAAPRAPGPRGGRDIPDFMKLKPDADAAAAAAAKAKLTEALKPSADMMESIMANPALMQARGSAALCSTEGKRRRALGSALTLRFARRVLTTRT